MGKYTYDDVKSFIDYNKNSTEAGYGFPTMPKLNNVIGNIQRGHCHTISGLPGAGTTSFIDQNYVISVLLQWYSIEADERPPLKILYYSTSATEMKKLQLLLCNYIRLVNNLQVDISTLNSQKGKIYNLDKKPEILAAIEDASVFFSDVIDEGILTIYDGAKTPTDIYNDVNTYYDTKGSIGPSGAFELEDEYREQTTIVIVEVDYLSADMDGHGIAEGAALDLKMQRYLTEMKREYKITPVLSLVSNPGYIRSVKDTEPHYKHLGSYTNITDKGICLYDPILEGNVKLYDADPDRYITSKGNNLLRYWYIVRNSEGISSVSNAIFFLPGTSYMIEPDPKTKVGELEDVLLEISKPSPFFNLI